MISQADVSFHGNHNLCSRGRNGDIDTRGVSVGAYLCGVGGSKRRVVLMPISSRGRTSRACQLEIPGTRQAVKALADAMMAQVVALECTALADHVLQALQHDPALLERIVCALAPDVADALATSIEVARNNVGHYATVTALSAFLVTLDDSARTIIAAAIGFPIDGQLAPQSAGSAHD